MAIHARMLRGKKPRFVIEFGHCARRGIEGHRGAGSGRRLSARSTRCRPHTYGLEDPRHCLRRAVRPDRRRAPYIALERAAGALELRQGALRPDRLRPQLEAVPAQAPLPCSRQVRRVCMRALPLHARRFPLSPSDSFRRVHRLRSAILTRVSRVADLASAQPWRGRACMQAYRCMVKTCKNGCKDCLKVRPGHTIAAERVHSFALCRPTPRRERLEPTWADRPTGLGWDCPYPQGESTSLP